MKATISVIIPVYNEAKTIAACLDSLRRQSSKYPMEIVVVDDGSTDGSDQIIKKFPVKFLGQNHEGPGKARNLGASQSSGDILVFVDADMTFDKDFIKNLIAPIVSGQTKGVFNVDEFVSNYDRPWARYWNLNQGLPDMRRLNPQSTHDIKDFRAILRSEFDRVGGFDPTGYTDSQTLSNKLKYLPTPVSGAISYHANPETPLEVFRQTLWIGRRQVKLGLIGRCANFVRYSLPFSLLVGLTMSHEPGFVVFKIVYDFGFWLGNLSALGGVKNK